MNTPFIHTNRGGRFYYGKGYADIWIEDIAHHLSHVARFCGATNFHYSVGQHSLLVEWIIKESYNGSPQARLRALLHDAHEYAMGDVPTPFQVWLRDTLCDGVDYLAKAKELLDEEIFTTLNLPPISAKEQGEIHAADKSAFIIEARQVFHREPEWLDEYAELNGLTIIPHQTLLPSTPEYVREKFLERYHELVGLVAESECKDRCA